MKGIVIGLDSSTTSTKAIAFDAGGTAVAQSRAAITLSSPRPHCYEQDPSEWWSSARTALRGITGALDPKSIAAIAISNQRETFVALDREDNPVRPAIVWLDERCKAEVAPFSRKIGRRWIHRITGKPPDYAPVVYRLAWMKRHEPDLLAKAAMVCDVHAFLVRKLAGVFHTSRASADPFGLFDLRKKSWSVPILSALDLPVDRLPKAFPPGTVIGNLTEDAAAATGLPTGLPIIAGGGDGQAAGLGVNALAPERAYLNLGTAVVCGIFGAPYRTHKAFRTMSSVSGSGYYYECSLRAGTFAIDWFIRNMLGVDASAATDAYLDLERRAERIPAGSDGLFFLPYLCGVMNPYWDMNAGGAFTGLSSFHDRGHMFRSILEGIAFEQALAIACVEKAVGAEVTELVAIGGGASNDLWCRIIADVTGRNVLLPEATEASCLGAGWYPTFGHAAREMTRTRTVITPNDGNRKRYHGLFARYKRIYPGLR